MSLQVGRHPNIVQLLEVFPTEHHLAIVMEFAAGGDLSELIDARGSQDVSGLCRVLHPQRLCWAGRQTAMLCACRGRSSATGGHPCL